MHIQYHTGCVKTHLCIRSCSKVVKQLLKLFFRFSVVFDWSLAILLIVGNKVQSIGCPQWVASWADSFRFAGTVSEHGRCGAAGDVSAASGARGMGQRAARWRRRSARARAKSAGAGRGHFSENLGVGVNGGALLMTNFVICCRASAPLPLSTAEVLCSDSHHRYSLKYEETQQSTRGCVEKQTSY